ncbi:MAG: hypothetical protein FJX57_18340 [Alphaproteobacteria bacterium]|nr:hypothetical protein [Alphaproteobacteria bacterium]
MHTVVKAVLAAGVATLGASYLLPSAANPHDRAACQSVLDRRAAIADEALRIIEIAVAPVRPGSYRGTVEGHGASVHERRRFTCRIEAGQATVVIFWGKSPIS